MAIASAQSVTAMPASIQDGARAAAPNDMEALGQRFLQLLVAQLKNQDPLNPLDNAQMTLQLAQMSTVEGINRLNAGLDALLDSQRASQALQTAALIGRQVLVAGDRLSLAGGEAIGVVELKATADRVRIEVLDAAGERVRWLELGALPAGVHRFVWDGRDAAGVALPSGDYRYKVIAERGAQAVAATPLSMDRVRSVILAAASVELELEHSGRQGLDTLRQIF
ncbi:MAG: flagellar hook assembly protein FlgD [Thiobacillaceae bacterium]|nr:flagellar hook assembly protein FlgD [Thiobacillaceae bacterium]MCX7673804.1 flagellar hook assembly protein FlgD [Thiobacillaceae bacterium]MDW8323562.1 flagellar hook assembly protein FlgD [Burkholderiales bacterium]